MFCQDTMLYPSVLPRPRKKPDYYFPLVLIEHPSILAGAFSINPEGNIG